MFSYLITWKTMVFLNFFLLSLFPAVCMCLCLFQSSFIFLFFRVSYLSHISHLSVCINFFFSASCSCMCVYIGVTHGKKTSKRFQCPQIRRCFDLIYFRCSASFVVFPLLPLSLPYLYMVFCLCECVYMLLSSTFG